MSKIFTTENLDSLTLFRLKRFATIDEFIQALGEAAAASDNVLASLPVPACSVMM